MVKYLPHKGDILWLDFDPQSGHEQAGRRPALVVSGDVFHQKTNMTVVCPITTRQSSFPLHLALPEICHTRGMVMTEQIKSLDFAARHADFIERVPEDFAATVKNYINTFWQ